MNELPDEKSMALQKFQGPQEDSACNVIRFHESKHLRIFSSGVFNDSLLKEQQSQNKRMVIMKAKRDAFAKSKIMESEIIRQKYAKRRIEDVNNGQILKNNQSLHSSPLKGSMQTIEEEVQNGPNLL